MKPNYLKVVEWYEADECFIGSAPPLIGPCCHGKDEKAVYDELCVIVEEWISIHMSDNLPLPTPSGGKNYSGKFMVRVGENLHRELSIRALANGESLNSYITKKLTTA